MNPSFFLQNKYQNTIKVLFKFLTAQKKKISSSVLTLPVIYFHWPAITKLNTKIRDQKLCF